MTYPAILEHEIKIQSYLVDDEMNLSMPALFGLIQEISSEHVSLCEIGWHHLREKNLFWVLSKIYIQIERLPKWSEKVVIRTWGKLHDLLINPRDYEILDEMGNVIIKGTSSWVILEGNTGKVQKLDDFEKKLVYPENKEAVVERAPKVPKLETSEEVAYNRVLTSDIDMNKHVNNSHYIQWAVDSVSQAFRKTHRLKNAIVNYLMQAKLGDIYGVISKEIEQNIYLTSIFSKQDKKEFCRIRSSWEEK